MQALDLAHMCQEQVRQFNVLILDRNPQRKKWASLFADCSASSTEARVRIRTQL